MSTAIAESITLPTTDELRSLACTREDHHSPPVLR